MKNNNDYLLVTEVFPILNKVPYPHADKEVGVPYELLERLADRIDYYVGECEWMEEKIESLEDEIVDLEVLIDEKETEVADLENEIEDLESDISNLEDEINDLNKLLELYREDAAT